MWDNACALRKMELGSSLPSPIQVQTFLTELRDEDPPLPLSDLPPFRVGPGRAARKGWREFKTGVEDR